AERAVADRIRGIARDDGSRHRVGRGGHRHLTQLLRQGHTADELVNRAHEDNHDSSAKESQATCKMGAKRKGDPMRRPKSSRTSSAKRSRSRSVGSAARAGGAAEIRDPAKLALLPDDALLEAVQRRTFRYFWEAAHPNSGLAFDRRAAGIRADESDPITIGGSGFGVMALIVAAERGWVARDAALERLDRMLDLLSRARCYHGAFPHFMNGSTGAAVPFGRKD